MTKQEINENYTKKFDERCAKINAHGFLHFISHKDSFSNSILKTLADVEYVLDIEPIAPPKKINFDEDMSKIFIGDFFKKYFPRKSIEALAVLNKTNPYFFDSDDNCHINFINVSENDKSKSCVGHKDMEDFLTFDVFLHGNLDDLRITTHEIAHAISNHHKKIVDIISFEKDEKKIISYQKKHQSFEYDCIGEIESHIVERLFNQFLYKNKILDKKDLKNYDNSQISSLVYEINLIREESDIIKNLPCPVTTESLNKLMIKLDSQENFRLVDRVQKMIDDNKNSPYMFRYVVGRIVAFEWFKKFDSLKTNDERCSMLETFERFLDKTDSLTLNKACKTLLGKNFLQIADDFIVDMKGKNNNFNNEIEYK